jgi:DNA-binding protein H-NS
MAAYGITAEELSRPAAKAVKPRQPMAKTASPAKAKKPGVPSPMKYRGPEGQGWTGHGTAPRWLNDLVAAGQTREDFLIRQDGTPASGGAASE